MCQHRFLYLDEVTHPGSNRIHDRLAVTVADYPRDSGIIMFTMQINHLCHLCHLGIHQRHDLVECCFGRVDEGQLAQVFQSATDAVTHKQVGLQESLVTCQKITSLTRLGIFQFGQNIVSSMNDQAGVPACL